MNITSSHIFDMSTCHAMPIPTVRRGMLTVHVDVSRFFSFVFFVCTGLMSYLFIGGSVYLCDHVAGTWSDALSQFRNPDYDTITAHVQNIMTRGDTKVQIEAENVKFKVRKHITARHVTVPIPNGSAELNSGSIV